MIATWAAAALAAPVLVEEPLDPFARCVADAEAIAGELPPPLPPLDGRRDQVAVVIGVPCHRAQSVPSLAYSTRDAARVSALLADAGFTVIPLLTVVDRADVYAALDRAASLVSPDGTLLVYFSGHGVLREEDGALRRYLVLSDTDLPALHATGIEVRSLELRVDGIVAGERVIVQDTCFAARSGGKSLGQAGAAGEKGIGRLEAPLRLVDGDLRLYASRFFEQAVESPELGGSVYTAHWLDAFARPEADLDGDTCVGLIEAHRWAAARTVEARDGFQVPQLRGQRAANLPLGCAPQAPTRAVIRARAGEEDDLLTVRGPDGASVSVDGGLAPGRYRLRLDQLETVDGELVPRRVIDATTRLDAGEWLDVAAEVERRAGFGAVVAEVRIASSPDEHELLAGGLGAWAVARDRGAGRALVGASVHAAPVGEGEAYGEAGWAWDLRLRGPIRAGAGPVVGAGVLWADSRRASGVGSLGHAAGRLWWTGGRVAGTVAIGARGLVLAEDTDPDTRGDTIRVRLAPLVTVGVGGRL